MTSASPPGKFQISEVRKTLVTALGMIVAVGTYVADATDLIQLPPGVVAGITAAVGIATIVLNYLAPNETDTAERAVNRSVRLRKPRTKPRAAKRASTRPPRRTRRQKAGRHSAPEPVEPVE
ncbi:membrane protein [Mycobacterium phage Indlovu]|nr:membrane protein [Mycobacterium phage Indlovu]